MRQTYRVAGTAGALLAMVGAACFCPAAASADDLAGALRHAIELNPLLNAQRHATRATHELVAQAHSRFLPKVSANADAGFESQTGQISTSGTDYRSNYATHPRGYGVSLTQTLYDGNRTGNGVLLARAQADGAVDSLKVLEQATLYDAAGVYTAVLRDQEAVDLNIRSTEFLRQQLKFISDRHAYGDATRSDIAQASARLAASSLRLNNARQALAESQSLYRQIIGVDPGLLRPARPPDELVPADRERALALAFRNNPAISAADSALRAAVSQRDIVRGEFAPTVAVTASVSKRYDSSYVGTQQVGQSVIGQISIPIFDGGNTLSRSRQANDTIRQKQLELDAAHDQVRTSLVNSWGQLQNAKAQVALARTQFLAASQTLSDSVAQYRYGQKTLSDLLLAQQDVLDGGLALVAARRERILAAFAVARATGVLEIDSISADLDERGGGAPAFAVPTFQDRRPSAGLKGSLIPQSMTEPCDQVCALDAEITASLRPRLDPLLAPLPAQTAGLRTTMK